MPKHSVINLINRVIENRKEMNKPKSKARHKSTNKTLLINLVSNVVLYLFKRRRRRRRSKKPQFEKAKCQRKKTGFDKEMKETLGKPAPGSGIDSNEGFEASRSNDAVKRHQRFNTS